MNLSQPQEKIVSANGLDNKTKNVDTKAFTFSTKEISKFQEMANKYEQDNNKQPREKLSFDASKKVDFGDSSKETKDKENREMIQNFLDAYNGLEKQDKEQLNRNYPQLQLLIEDLTKILHPYIMKTKEQQRAEKTTETVWAKKIETKEK